MQTRFAAWTTATTLALAALGARLAPGGDEPWESATRFASNGDGYMIALVSEPDPPPDNDEFALTVWVLDPDDPARPLVDVSLDVDASMPEHGHGMNRVPSVTRRADGGFDVRGMLFHMIGTWELYLDVTRGAVTERAQRTLELE